MACLTRLELVKKLESHLSTQQISELEDSTETEEEFRAEAVKALANKARQLVIERNVDIADAKEIGIDILPAKELTKLSDKFKKLSERAYKALEATQADVPTEGTSEVLIEASETFTVDVTSPMVQTLRDIWEANKLDRISAIEKMIEGILNPNKQSKGLIELFKNINNVFVNNNGQTTDFIYSMQKALLASKEKKKLANNMIGLVASIKQFKEKVCH